VQAPTGNVDEDIDAAVIRDDFLKGLLNIGFSGHIQSDKPCLSAAFLNFGCDSTAAFLVDIENHDGAVVPGQTLGNRLANP
jgi:hypothetical protein